MAAEPLREPLLEVNGLHVEAGMAGSSRDIVTSFDFRVDTGETIAIVGESGSGKSLSARAVIQLLPRGVRADGSVRLDGRDLLMLNSGQMQDVRGRDISLVLQDPFTMLNPVMRCGAQIVEAMDAKMGRSERRAEAVRRLAEVGIHDPSVADRYPFQLSGGMRQRVAIAAALAGDPKLLIADEPSTALDVTTQAEILTLLKTTQERRGMGLILITHDLRVAFSVAARVYVLYAGSLVEYGNAGELEAEPLHPYTLGLLLSEPAADRRQVRLASIEGAVPSPAEVAGRCSFEPRCLWAADVCRHGDPPLVQLSHDRASACIRINEIRHELAAARTSAAEERQTETGISSGAPQLVRVTALQKTFHGRTGQPVHALRDVSIEIREGEAIGLVGESGSGKTTLGRCLVGLEMPSSGEILVDGFDASDYEKLSRADRMTLRQTVQIVFQDPYSSLDRMQTIGSVLRETLIVNGRRRNAEGRVGELLEIVGLPAGYSRRRPVTLSGGERQRVAIARALAVEPKLIVCDEPVSALDVSVQAQILNLLRELRATLGLSYLFITHDLAVVRQIVDRIYVLYRGEVVEAGPVDSVLDSPTHAYTQRLIASIPRSAV